MMERTMKRAQPLMALPFVLLCVVLCVLGAACGDDAMNAPDAVFPADYGDTYTEVRDCRQSGDHDLNVVRVLADPAALAAYADRTEPFPEGAVVIKEEYEFGDIDCTGPIIQWTAMEKLPVDSAPDMLDWRWQKVDADGVVVQQDGPRCAACHQGCGVPPDGYDGTCTVP